MRYARFAVVSLVWVFILIPTLSCGGEAPSGSAEQVMIPVGLYAGKGIIVELNPSTAFQDDSLTYSLDGMPVELVFLSGDLDIQVSANLVPGSGSSAEERSEYLASMGVSDLSVIDVPAMGDDEGFRAVLYSSNDNSVVERVWQLGAGELAILQTRALMGSPSMLLSAASVVLRGAELIVPQESGRGIYLSDRTRTEMIEQVNADVDLPPDVHHQILIEVDPAGRRISVADTLTVDFNTTLSDSLLAFLLPPDDSGSDLVPIQGRVTSTGDSVLCSPDSTRLFRGVYNGSWSSYASASPDSITGAGMQIRPASTFQCGMWLYPGCGVPASYRLDVEMPAIGYDVYVPMTETSRTSSDASLRVSFASPEGDLRGPLALAIGGFDRIRIAGDRSEFLFHSSDSSASGSREYVEELADVIWDQLGFTGARLDFVVVRSLDVPVFLVGPGCVFASEDVLTSLAGRTHWADSLTAGVRVPETSVAYGAATAFLSRSTWLSPGLRGVLSAWIVYRFVSEGDQESGTMILESFLRYYLYSVELAGGVEYAMADPELAQIWLESPVLLGKGPVVIEFLSREIPAFTNALRRALGYLRHAGDSYGRLFSSMGLPGTGQYSELFNRWLYAPGLPRMRVTWQDSSGVIDLRLVQLQPGQDFPLGSVTESILVHSDEGSATVDLLPGTAVGRYSGVLPAWMQTVTAIDLDPSRTLPADIVYNREVLR